MAAETSSSSSLPELILSLEEAIIAAKHLPSAAAGPPGLVQVRASLQRAHAHLSAALRALPLPAPPPPPENSDSLSSSDEPMQLADEDDGAAEAEAEGAMVEGVEAKMRDCFIRNTRRKRPLSPSAAAMAEEERRRRGGDQDAAAAEAGEGFDPYAARLRALELVYQFHG